MDGFQEIGDNVHPAEDGHEVRVAAPSGHDVNVYVIGQPRAGASADVQADIKPVRPNGVLETRLQISQKFHDFSHRRRVQIGEVSHVGIWRDQAVPARIGKTVHHGEGIRPAPEHQVFFVIFGLVAVAAEEAPLLRPHQGVDVLHPPRRPKVSLTFSAVGGIAHNGGIYHQRLRCTTCPP